MAFTRILELKNEIEANLLSSLLDERKIAHVVRRTSNPALEGFFQTNFGWGWLEADERDAAAIRETCADLRAASPVPETGEEESGGEKTE